MNRQKLLGLSAMLNVVQATLDQEGREYKAAANHVNAAVVEIHHAAKWSAQEQHRRGRSRIGSWSSWSAVDLSWVRPMTELGRPESFAVGM